MRILPPIMKWILIVMILIVVLAGTGLTVFADAGNLQVRQELFTPSMPKGDQAENFDQTIVRSRYVNINFSLLDNAIQSEAILLNLYDDVLLTAILERKELIKPDGYAWIGHLQDVEFSQVILVVSGGQMAGNISSPLGHYQIRFSGNQTHAVYTIDQSAFPEEQPSISIESSPGTSPQITATSDLCTAIDVMVVWTPAARTAAGGITAIQNLVNLAVQETNQSYINSNMTQRIRLAFMQEVAYAESGDFATDLTRLKNPSDGFIDNVHSLRNTYYADMVSMFTEGTQYCGIGYLMFNVSPAFESNAFTVIARNCATGNYSFAHELGHNQGARHDWYMDTNTTPYAYAHGYVNTVKRWRTIMAYNDQCQALGYYCPKVPYWSNPGIIYGGDPMGVPSGSFHPADNHLTLNNTCNTAANFRDKPDSPAAFNKINPSNGATNISSSITLSWGSSSGATDFEYCYDTSNDSACSGSWISASANTSVALSGLLGGTTYYWQVRATNSDAITYANNSTWWSFSTKSTSQVRSYLPLVQADN